VRSLLDLAPSRKLALLLALAVLATLGLAVLAEALPIDSALLRAVLVAAVIVPATVWSAKRLEPSLEVSVLRLARDAREALERPEGSLAPRSSDGAGERLLATVFNELLARLRERENLLERGRATFEGEVAARTLELAQHNERLQYAMEEARAAALLKAQLLANMSHELRTPMNGILGMNDLLLDSALSDQQRSYAEIIKSSAESLLEIIADILDFSKMEAGKLQLDTIEFDLHRTVEEVVQLLSSAASKKELRLSCALAPDVPRSVRGDPTRLRQVLTNLIGNAVKFTEHGQVMVDVSRAEELDDRVRLRFQVQDTGMGIPQDRQLQMFLPFSQVDPSATRRHGGTGLGLSISKQLVELLGGQIGFQSELGVGSVFWFTAVFELGTTGLFRSIALPEGVALPRVLVADASTATREVLHQQLAAWGFEHEVVSDAERAVGALRRALEAGRSFGVCLVDTGLLASSELQAFLRERPRLLAIPLSWNAEDFPEGPRSLRKPVRPSALYDALVAVLDSDELATVAAEDLDPMPVGWSCEAESSLLRVLLAEDNAVNQTVAIKILARGGFRCDVVGDGRAAVEAVEREPYDVVLMDCQMPELDGFEAAREIRRFESQRPERRPAHVIALTANAMEGDRERCLEAGMDDYLPKPIKPALLLERLRQRSRLARAAGTLRRDAPAPASIVAAVRDAPAVEPQRQDIAAESSRRMLDLARELEQQADDLRLDRVDSILDALRAELARCRASLAAEKERPSS